MAVTFFTNCYEGDWRSLLLTGRLEDMIKVCNYHFFSTILIINNVRNRSEVEKIAQKKVEDGVLSAYYFSDDYAEKVLKTLNIKKSSFITDFHDGYWYSIAPLCSIYLCNSSHLVYFTCDCILKSNKTNWIDEGIELLKDPLNLVINPIWVYQQELAKKESRTENEKYFKGSGFSDQCFLISIASFKKNIYNEFNASSYRYPVYSGNSFERRVNSFMKNHELNRITIKNIEYEHEKIIDEEYQCTDNKYKKLKTVAGQWSRRIKIKLTKYLKYT